MREQFKQIWVIMSTAWVRNLHYRSTIAMYRLGEVVELLALILMWSAIYAGGSGAIKGFTLNEMITYVLIGNLSALAVRNFLPAFVSRDITDGRLSMFLVKPIPYLKYIFFNELGRSALATIASTTSQFIIILFFLDKILFNTDIRYLGLMGLMIMLAFVIELFLGFLIGMIAFWTEEVEGIQAAIDRVKRFFSGGYFPITLLPATYVTVSSYLPFQYSFFAPAGLYMKKISLQEGLHGILVQLIWIIFLFLLIQILWRRGLRRYEATGS